MPGFSFISYEKLLVDSMLVEEMSFPSILLNDMLILSCKSFNSMVNFPVVGLGNIIGILLKEFSKMVTLLIDSQADVSVQLL